MKTTVLRLVGDTPIICFVIPSEAIGDYCFLIYEKRLVTTDHHMKIL